MAVPDWPSTYGYNLFLYPWQTWLSGPWDLFIEHGHRLLGALVGMLTIAAAVCIWRYDDRRWLKVLSVVAILAVIAQGVLGGLRVLLDARTLAMIHGCTGPAFFGFAIALSAFTSRWWRTNESRRDILSAAALQRLAVLTAGMAYCQLVLGARVRHIALGSTPDSFQAAVILHLGMAILLALHVAWLAIEVWQHHRGTKAWGPANLLAVLVVLQIALGIMTWVAKYGWPAWLVRQGWGAAHVVSAGSIYQASIVTAHVAVGSLIFATSLLLALRSLRLFRDEPVEASIHFRSFLGVAA